MLDRITNLQSFSHTFAHVLRVRWYGVTINDPELEHDGELHNGKQSFCFSEKGLAQLGFEWAFQCKLAEMEARKGSAVGEIADYSVREREWGREVSFTVNQSDGLVVRRRWCIRFDGESMHVYDFVG